jgi:hypothetical protein
MLCQDLEIPEMRQQLEDFKGNHVFFDVESLVPTL